MSAKRTLLKSDAVEAQSTAHLNIDFDAFLDDHPHLTCDPAAAFILPSVFRLDEYTREVDEMVEKESFDESAVAAHEEALNCSSSEDL